MKLQPLVLLLAYLGAIACTPTDNPQGHVSLGGQTGEEKDGCQMIDRQALDLEDATSLGFSAAELMGNLGDERHTTLHWTDETTSLLHIRMSEPNAIRLVRFEPSPSSREIEGLSCGDEVRLEVRLELETEDGLFDEKWRVELHATSSDRAEGRSTYPIAELSGSFSETQDPQSSAQLHIQFVLSDGLWSGALHLVYPSQGEDPDTSVSDQAGALAHF